MKYDPVICGLCSAEDVTQRRQTQTCSGKLQQMGEDYILYFVPRFPTLLNFPSYDTQSSARWNVERVIIIIHGHGLE